MNTPKVSSATSQKPWYFLPALVIISGCLVAIVNFGIRSTFGMFTAPLSAAHEWPREIFSLGIAIQNLIWGLATPLAGALADRYGAARVIIGGSLVYCFGVVMMAIVPTAGLFYLTAGLISGTGIAFSSFSIVMAALGRIVPPEKRSWAFGIATASGSLGQFIFAPLSSALISAYGWEQALVILGLSALSMLIFVLPLFAQKPDGHHAVGREADLTMKAAIACAFHYKSYLLLTAGFFVCGFQLAFITVHLPPFLADNGINKEVAGLALGSIGLFNVIGCYMAGIIGGRGKKRLPLSLIYFIRALATVLFISFPITDLSTFLFAAVMGLLWLSTVPLTMGLVVVMFGTRYMATLYGFVFLSHQIGSFFGVWLGGRLYDQYHSYSIVWWVSVVLCLGAALINLPIREVRAPQFAAQ